MFFVQVQWDKCFYISWIPFNYEVLCCSRHTNKRNVSGGVKKENGTQRRSTLVDASTPLVKQSHNNTQQHQSTAQVWSPPITELS